MCRTAALPCKIGSVPAMLTKNSDLVANEGNSKSDGQESDDNFSQVWPTVE
jgi:hypothetical protein